MSELLLCPFCGGEADVTLCQSRWGQSYTIHHDANGKCPAEYIGSMNFATEAEAITAWNTRAERTCRFIIKDNMNETEGMGDVWIECSACHCTFDYYADDWLMKMSYCPNCGARVIGGNE